MHHAGVNLCNAFSAESGTMLSERVLLKSKVNQVGQVNDAINFTELKPPA